MYLISEDTLVTLMDKNADIQTYTAYKSADKVQGDCLALWHEFDHFICDIVLYIVWNHMSKPLRDQVWWWWYEICTILVASKYISFVAPVQS